jgi:hypothetical protein
MKVVLYLCLLPKLGSSNLQEQTLALEQVLPLFKEYKIIGVADLRYERLNMPVIETSIHKASGC